MHTPSDYNNSKLAEWSDKTEIPVPQQLQKYIQAYSLW